MSLGGLCQCMHVVAEFSIGNFFVLIKLLLYPSNINMCFPFLKKISSSYSGLQMLTNKHLMVGGCDGDKLTILDKSPNCFFKWGGAVNYKSCAQFLSGHQSSVKHIFLLQQDLAFQLSSSLSSNIKDIGHVKMWGRGVLCRKFFGGLSHVDWTLPGSCIKLFQGLWCSKNVGCCHID